MTGKQAPAQQAAVQAEARLKAESREGDLVAAADKGFRPYFEAAGYRRLGLILLGAACFALVAQNRLRHQDYLFGSLAVFVSIFILSLIPAATPWGVRNRARTEAKGLRRSAARLLRRNRGKLDPSGAAEVDSAIEGIDRALGESRGTPALEARNALDAALDKHLASARKSAAREYTESIGGAILVALLLRAFVFEPFHIPSGSMIPTLLVGDFIFVNKMSYGLRIPFTDPATVHKIAEKAPGRGDVVVFILPSHPDVTYVKRVIGLPGDHIEVHDNVVSVNGVEQARTLVGDYTSLDHSEYTDTDIEVTGTEYSEDLMGRRHAIIVRKDPAYSRSGSFVVEAGRAFMMGDNRDNSSDSRVEGGIGQIPFSYIKGRASLIWLSFGGSAGVRFSRLFHTVD